MKNASRRGFVSWCAASAAAAVAAGVAGCGEGAQKQEGTMAENPPEIQEALQTSSESYLAVKKKKKK